MLDFLKDYADVASFVIGFAATQMFWYQRDDGKFGSIFVGFGIVAVFVGLMGMVGGFIGRRFDYSFVAKYAEYPDAMRFLKQFRAEWEDEKTRKKKIIMTWCIIGAVFFVAYVRVFWL